MKTILLKENVTDLIGKTIKWNAPAYEMNSPYGGTALIKAIDFTQRRPITAETISGDDIGYAFLDNYGLKLNPDGESYSITDDNTAFAYSDGDRAIEFEVLEK